MRNMAFEIVGDLFIVIHNAKPPSDAEWASYLRSWQGRDMSKMRTLVFTAGGGPSTAQRKEANTALGGKPSVTSVVSDSAMVRGIVTALSWFNSEIKAFNPTESTEAFRHLGITHAGDIERLWAQAKKLQAGLAEGSLGPVPQRAA